jgi:hypothetical protein
MSNPSTMLTANSSRRDKKAILVFSVIVNTFSVGIEQGNVS